MHPGELEALEGVQRSEAGEDHPAQRERGLLAGESALRGDRAAEADALRGGEGALVVRAVGVCERGGLATEVALEGRGRLGEIFGAGLARVTVGVAADLPAAVLKLVQRVPREQVAGREAL